MKAIKKIAFLFFILLVSFHVFGQEIDKDENDKPYDDKDLVQFSGVVVTADSLFPIPFTHIVVKHSRWGTVADYYGYFSFVAKKNDTVVFSAMGYKNSTYIIPDTISKNRYSLIKAMTSDTLMLDETVIYPWPSKEQFKQAFVMLEIPTDDLQRARRNLALEEMREKAESLSMDGSMNYKNYMEWEGYKNYYIGQTQPISLLDPFAWAKFFQAWKEGKFKRKK